MKEKTTDLNIENMIYEINGKQVMLDRDIAKICVIETKRINETFSRNYDKFSDFIAWRLSDEDVNFLVADCDQKIEKRGSKYNNPRVFTLEGIEVLSTIIKSKISYELLEKIRESFVKKNRPEYSLITAKKNESIENFIYEVRGKYVMLDSDLARLYKCENGTKTINLSVKRHIDRFPDDFYFQLTKKELENLKFQNETSSWNEHGGIRKLPYAFTQEGIAMLSTVLRTSVAAKVSVNIMRAFVEMKRYFINNKDIYVALNNINNSLTTHDKRLLEHDKKFEEIFAYFDKKNENELLYFDGQVYDSYSKLLEIMKRAKKKLIIIDGYADNILLDMVSKIEVKVILIVKKK